MDLEKGTFISSVSPYPEEEYYLGKSQWSASAADWDQRFEVGDVIANPSGSWTPGTAEQYIDSQIATVNTNLANETIGRQTGDRNLQTQLQSEMNTRADQDANLNALINAGIREGSGVQFDIIPTQNSANGITSGGMFDVLSGEKYKYAASFYPWCLFSTNFSVKESYVTMPACFAYLKAYANSVKTNANWFATSGITRGAIPNLVRPLKEVGEAIMHVLQGDTKYDGLYSLNKVNPIYNAGTYGYRIWGNRVAWNTQDISNLLYQEFLNVRILLCDIKKQIYHSAMRVTFEPNDDIVWVNFKTLANTLLDKMKSGRGLQYYRWSKEISPKATIKASLTIKPIEAVESFDINIILTEEETTVDEI